MFDFVSQLKALEEQGLKRSLRVLDSHSKLINFSTNDYLGLAGDIRLKNAAKLAIDEYGTSASSSRLLSGTFPIHTELEEKLAQLKGKEAALVFSSGYHANLGIITTLLGKGDAVIIDRLCHASIIDGCRLSGARLLVYNHCDPDSLNLALRHTNKHSTRLVITEGIFSMDGDIAPLSEIARLAKNHKAYVMVDDAHGTGVIGHDGRGTTGITDSAGAGNVDIIMGTLSKALGSLGGFVCASRILIDFLINKARPFIYTTALPPSQAASALAAIEIIKQEPWRREKVLSLAGTLRNKLTESRFRVLGAGTPIVPVVTGDTVKTLEIAELLHKNGIVAPAIRPPTVPNGSCRLRFSVTANHSLEDIDMVVACLRKIKD